jgi:hypothetical protein
MRKRGFSTLAIAVAGLMVAGVALAASSPQDQMFSAFAPTAPIPSASLESNHVLRTGAGNLYGFQANFVTCASAPCWVMVFDATALPSNGTVTPVKWYQANQNQTIGVRYSPPLKMTTGIVVGCSTTGPFTLTATAQCAISGEPQ